jgi:hypothetical protein
LQVLARLQSYQPELRLAFRATVAATLGYVLSKLLALPQGYWVVITAVIVMQASLGGSVKAAADRMAGTLAGAGFGALISIVVPHASDVTLGFAVVAAIAPMALLAALRPSFRVAPITALIVVVPSPGSTVGPLAYAIERVAEITLGNLIGVGVALFVLPSRAHDLLAESAARVCELNAELLGVAMDAFVFGHSRESQPNLHARIRSALKTIETAADEALRERRSHLTELIDPDPLVRTLYRVRHDLVMIGRATLDPMPTEMVPRLEESLLGVRDASVALLLEIAEALRTGSAGPGIARFRDSLGHYVGTMDKLRADGVMRTLDSPDVGRLYAVRFAFEQLGLDLRDLVARVDDMSGRRVLSTAEEQA